MKRPAMKRPAMKRPAAVSECPGAVLKKPAVAEEGASADVKHEPTEEDTPKIPQHSGGGLQPLLRDKLPGLDGKIDLARFVIGCRWLYGWDEGKSSRYWINKYDQATPDQKDYNDGLARLSTNFLVAEINQSSAHSA